MDSGFEEFLGDVPLPEARAAFRSDLRGQFVAGGLAPAAGEPARKLAPRPARGTSRTPGAARTRREIPSRSRGPRFLKPLLAAAALVIVFLGARQLPWFGAPGEVTEPVVGEVPSRPTASSWRVAYLGDAGPIRIDDREVGPAEVGSLVGELLAGEGAPRIASEDCRLLLTWNEALVIELAEGTELRTAVLTAGAVEPSAFDLLSGEVLVRTAQPFSAGPLLFRTPQAEVLVTGTTLGISTGEFTCVCVCEGEVVVTDRATGASSAVHGDHTRLLYGDGRVVDVGFDQVTEAHAEPLRQLHDQDLAALFD